MRGGAFIIIFSLAISTTMNVRAVTNLFVFVLAMLLPPAALGFTGADWSPLPKGEVSRIAFGSCAMQWKEQPVWSTVVEANPDVFLFIGDAIYGDWDGKKVVPASEKSLLRDWMKLAAIPEFKRLRKNVPVMATWDNHDYGTNNGGAEFPLKEISRQTFLNFFNEPAGSERRKTSGIFDAKIFGPPDKRLQIILLDTRYFKGRA